MRLSFKKILYLTVVLLVLCFIVFHIFRIYSTVQKTLANERARLIEQNRVPFEKKLLHPHLSQNLQILQNTGVVRGFVKFHGSYFAAASGGLVQISEDGKIEKHLTVLDGLPESDLTAITVYQDKLFIGTRTKDLVVFDGEKFESYVWTDRKAQAVTSFLETDGRLLIGTFGGGLIEFSGNEFIEIKRDGKRLPAINCLAKNGAALLTGTFNNGLWIYENDVWTQFTTAEGLPSNRVVGIAEKDENIYIATDFGLATLEDKSLRTLAVLPSLSGLARRDKQLFLAKDNGEIFTFDSSLKEFSGEKNSQNASLAFSADDDLWLLSNNGISKIGDAGIKPFTQTGNESLTDNFVSAIAFDKNENLWVGTFRSGIDVFSAEGKKLRHFEAENMREVNFLQTNEGAISAATSSGLINFKNDFSTENLTRKDGLPSDSITHFSAGSIATAKGLVFRENGKLRVLSTVQGLPGNSIYATLEIGKTLYAGTLGGLARIENGHITRVFKDSNSNLKTNWVTALCYAADRIFIGTYGGGLFEFLPSSNEIRSFETEIGKPVINPNSIFSDGERLYIGTLEGAKVLNLQTQEWTTVKQILPAEIVMSVAGNEENIYFGTTNGIAGIGKAYFRGGENE